MLSSICPKKITTTSKGPKIKPDYGEGECEVCEHKNSEYVGHPGGSQFHTVQRFWCEMGYWSDNF